MDSGDRALASFTSAVGLALGELLIALRKPEALDTCLSDIRIAAQGTILSSGIVCSVESHED